MLRNNNTRATRRALTLISASSWLLTSNVVRLGIVISFLVGALIVVSGIDAQNKTRSDAARDQGARKPAKTDKAKKTRLANFDVRLGAGLGERLAKDPSGDPGSVRTKALANRSRIEGTFRRLRSEHKNSDIELSSLTGGLEILRDPNGLTDVAPGRTGEDVVREFISENKDLYGLGDLDVAGLNFIGESVSPANGLRMVRVEQIVNGLPVFQSETRFILDRDGRLIRSLGLMAPNASEAATGIDGIMSPENGLKAAAEHLNIPLEVGRIANSRSEDNGSKNELSVADNRISGPVNAKLVYFSLAPGVLVPAWSYVIFGVDQDWYTLVDARDGSQLWRKQIRSDVSTHDARFRVYVQADGSTPADSPAPQSPSSAVPGAGTQFAGIAPSIVSMFTAQDLTASPNGWIDDCPGGVCAAAQTQTIGNNVHAYMDRVGGAAPGGIDEPDTATSSVLDGEGKPIGNPDANSRNRDFLGTSPRDFETNFLPPPQAGNPEAGQTATGNGNNGTLAVDQFRRGSVVQQFYNANWYHDKLYALGFDTAAGNFQNNNFGGGGSGNDRVLVEVQDSSGTNNANFSTPPDGQSGRAQMFRFTGPTIDRDGGLDAEILIHELTHGTSNRIIGNGSGLVWDIGAGMGEGWSDFYAMALLNNTNADDPNGNYASGAYATYKAFGVVSFTDNYVYGIRRFPYSTNNSVNPLTWADVDQSTYNQSGGIAVNPLGFEIGGAGEVHNVGEIWALTLWEVRSRIIAANGGSVPTGNQIALQLVTDAMKLTPASPSYIQARDALIDADCATNACANEESIWNGFADRGLGYGARVPNSVSFTPVAPHVGVVESFASADLDINTISISDANLTGFVDPNEPFDINVNIKNPWRGAAKTATGVSATLTSSTGGVSILTGSTTYPNIAPNGNQDRIGAALVAQAPFGGTCGGRLDFTLTITSSLGTVARNFSLRMGQPSGTLAPVTYTRSALGLAIQDNLPVGTSDSMAIADDYEIADIDVRIDSVIHTFPGDLTFSVKGPNGYGTDLLSFLGGAVSGGGAGDNITNMRFDDEATGEILLATNAMAPYTGSWRPIANSNTWNTLGFPPPDGTPNLSNFDGTSSAGVWSVIVSDQGAADIGTFEGWSLIVTPRDFVCTPFVPTAANASVSGRVVDRYGRAIYQVTVSLIDSGTGEVHYARTNSFGYFRIDDVPVGQTYVLTAEARRYTFEPRLLSIDQNVMGLELIGR